MANAQTINWLDIVVIVIIFVSGITAYYRGFILTVFKFTSFILTIIITNKIYPYVSTFIRNSTKIYTNLQEKISTSLNLSHSSVGTSLHQEIEMINNLNMPNIIKSTLLENNNYEIYKILKVDNINDYVAGYLANIGINIISMIFVFIMVGLVLKIIIQTLNLISKLPILNSINKMFGLVLGVIGGVLTVWILCIFITFFYTNPNFHNIISTLEKSTIAKFFYQNNLLMKTILDIFT